MSKGYVLIICPNAYVEGISTLMSLLPKLLHDWNEIHILSGSGDISLRKEFHGIESQLPRKAKSIWNPTRHFSTKLYRYVIALLRLFFVRLKGYEIIVAIDPVGLIFADRINRWSKRPIVYISFEIMFADELSHPEELKIKKREIEASKRVSLVLVQDEERANMLKAENKFTDKLISFVPNSPLPQMKPQSTYLRDKLNIPKGKRIVLYAGNIASWASRDILDEMVSYWPDDYILVLHSKFPISGLMHLFLKSLESTKKVYVSSDPLPQEKILNLYASADFGLACYKPVPENWGSYKNIYHIGLSSGKVAYYAMCGLPILASDLPAYRKWFAHYKCGATYKRISETGEMLISLEKNYEYHSREAFRFYKEQLNPVIPIEKFCKKLSKLVK